MKILVLEGCWNWVDGVTAHWFWRRAEGFGFSKVFWRSKTFQNSILGRPGHDPDRRFLYHIRVLPTVRLECFALLLLCAVVLHKATRLHRDHYRSWKALETT